MVDLDDDAVITGSGSLGAPSNENTQTELPEDPLRLEEHKTKGPFPLSKQDANFIKSLGGGSTPLSVSFTAEGTASISSSSYVGVATLPSSATIEVTPKETVSRLLDLLQYALDVPTNTIERSTELEGAETFIDAFGSLFHAELAEVLQQGIRRDYKRVQDVNETVRGRLDVQRQIRRPTPIPTDFAVEYDTFTSNTVLNQAVCAATETLTVLVEDEALSARLSHQANQLRQYVTPEPVSVEALSQIEITRLNEHYEDLLELTRIVLSRRFFEEIAVGQRESFGLFIDMNAIFESVVERAFREATERLSEEWSVEGQADIGNVISGPHAVNMTPDFVVRDADGTALLVGDAKWKGGGLSSNDVYQITSYMLAEESPGVLVYPQQGDRHESSSVQGPNGVLQLRSVELPTASEVGSFKAYQDRLVSTALTTLQKSVDRVHQNPA